MYLHFKQNITGKHDHLNGKPEHGIVLSVPGVVALQERLFLSHACPRVLGQVKVHEPQLGEGAAPFALFSHRYPQHAPFQHHRRGVGHHFAREGEFCPPFHRVVPHFFPERKVPHVVQYNVVFS